MNVSKDTSFKGVKLGKEAETEKDVTKDVHKATRKKIFWCMRLRFL